MRALVLGASGGIGGALVTELRARGAEVTGLSRRDGLDLTDAEAVSACAAKLAGQSFDLILNATGALTLGAPPEKRLAEIDPAVMARHFALNATGVALALQQFTPLLPRRGRAVFASLSARVGSIGDNHLGGWVSYRAAKAAQNQILRCAAIEMTRRNPESLVVALHPGTVETSLTADYAARYPTIPPERAARALLDVLDGLDPKDSGSFWDWRGAPVPW